DYPTRAIQHGTLATAHVRHQLVVAADVRVFAGVAIGVDVRRVAKLVAPQRELEGAERRDPRRVAEHVPQAHGFLYRTQTRVPEVREVIGDGVVQRPDPTSLQHQRRERRERLAERRQAEHGAAGSGQPGLPVPPTERAEVHDLGTQGHARSGSWHLGLGDHLSQVGVELAQPSWPSLVQALSLLTAWTGMPAESIAQRGRILTA